MRRIKKTWHLAGALLIKVKVFRTTTTAILTLRPLMYLPVEDNIFNVAVGFNEGQDFLLDHNNSNIDCAAFNKFACCSQRLQCCRWAFNEGQDFPQDHNNSNIDFAAFHLWPDNWLDNSTDFETEWIAQHIADASTSGKPVSPQLPSSICMGFLLSLKCCSKAF